jgi:thiol-disulfide isomerase/thioredoxin
MIHKHLFCIFLILVIILMFKLYLENAKIKTNKLKHINSSNPNTHNTHNTLTNKTTCNVPNCKCNKDNKSEDVNMDILLEKIKISTNQKINRAIEEGIREGFSSMNDGDSSNTNSSINALNSDAPIISYINKDNKIKLMLFYKPSCPYCQEFMPVWSQIINNLPNNILYEEINTSKSSENNKANEYKIVSVPTIILIVNNNKIKYEGNRSYENIERFLKENGVNLIIKILNKPDTFADSGYSNDPSPTSSPNPDCPTVSFDTKVDVANDDYMFQIFSTEGQYGYATGGIKPNKLLTPFAAAYSVVDSYLSSLPNKKNMNECADQYADNIMQFGLCDNEQLNNILNYNDSVKNGTANVRVDRTNYGTNTNVVNAIKYACNL